MATIVSLSWHRDIDGRRVIVAVSAEIQTTFTLTFPLVSGGNHHHADSYIHVFANDNPAVVMVVHAVSISASQHHAARSCHVITLYKTEISARTTG